MSPGSQPPSLPPAGDLFSCDVAREREIANVRTIGALDMGAVPTLSIAIEQARKAGCRRVILDLRGLDFIDSTGLRFILERYAESCRDGFTFALIPGPPSVQRLFELTRTVDHLPFIDPDAHIR